MLNRGEQSRTGDDQDNSPAVVNLHKTFSFLVSAGVAHDQEVAKGSRVQALASPTYVLAV